MGYDQRRIDRVIIIFFYWNNYELDDNREFNVRVWYLCMWFLGWLWIASESFTRYLWINENIISTIVKCSFILNIRVLY
jgi:hypothetical protein